jgi:hypothetical protein
MQMAADEPTSNAATGPKADRRLGLFLTLEEAAAELCAEVDAARAWLLERDLVHQVAGRDLVLPTELAAAVARMTAAPIAEFPAHSWRAVAAILGLSEDTIARRRKKGCDATPCHFIDAQEIRDWWRTLNAPPAATPARPRRRRSEAKPDAALDVKALVRELSRH